MNIDRTTGLGGHDVAAILGVHPYKTALDVYNEKVNKVDNFKLNYHSAIGLAVENVMIVDFLNKNYSLDLDFEEKHLFVDINESCYFSSGDGFRHENYEFFYAHPDGIVKNNKSREFSFIVECKSPTWQTLKHWGDEKTDEIPEYIIIQMAWYCFVLDMDRAVILRRSDFGNIEYLYERNHDLEIIIKNAALKFWNENIVKEIQPELQVGDNPAAVYFKSNGKEIEASEDIWLKHVQLNQVKEKIKELDADKSKLELLIKEWMGENELVKFNGEKLSSWKSQISNRFDTETFKKEHKELYDKYIKISESRVFRLK